MLATTCGKWLYLLCVQVFWSFLHFLSNIWCRQSFVFNYLHMYISINFWVQLFLWCLIAPWLLAMYISSLECLSSAGIYSLHVNYGNPFHRLHTRSLSCFCNMASPYLLISLILFIHSCILTPSLVYGMRWSCGPLVLPQHLLGMVFSFS